MRKTKIVCTIGPASESEEMIEKLINYGMNVSRLNFSHGSHEEHKGRIDTIRKVAKRLDKIVAIYWITKGAKSVRII
ncbi:pyruvate kinase [Staphylococcus aureus]